MTHRILNPKGLAQPVGFAPVVIPDRGTTVYLGGQTGHRADGTLAGEDLVSQFDQACANVVTAIRAAGGEPAHLAQLLIYATDVGEYRSLLKDLGDVYRRHFGKHYPTIALLGTTELFDPQAKVELVGIAVVPEG
jgi:enamine deaminase RidA (YjgF/YER057c/UK114 family)